MSGRGQDRIILVGTNGTGKSTLANKIIESSIAGEGRRALAVLPDDAEPIFFPYNEIQRTELKYIGNVANKKNKIYFDKKNIFTELENVFKNGCLILDDAKFYVGSADDELKKLFIRSRQNNVDIVFICHGLSEIPPAIITYTTKIILFNTVDSWKRLKEKIPNPEYFDQIVNEVRTQANAHKFTVKIIEGVINRTGLPFKDIFTGNLTKGKPFKFTNKANQVVYGIGCDAFNREKCNCGQAYIKKIIDVKRDLIITNGLE